MRYDSTSKIEGGTRYGTSETVYRLRLDMSSGRVKYTETVLTETQRLDILAGIEYNNSAYWWVIAAASNIGWGLQVPPGTKIIIPDIKYVLENF